MSLIALQQPSPLPSRFYPSENYLSSRCSISGTVREQVFPSWHQPLTSRDSWFLVKSCRSTWSGCFCMRANPWQGKRDPNVSGHSNPWTPWWVKPWRSTLLLGSLGWRLLKRDDCWALTNDFDIKPQSSSLHGSSIFLFSFSCIISNLIKFIISSATVYSSASWKIFQMCIRTCHHHIS